MDGLTIRNATANDLDRIAELIAGEPGQEAVAIAGCESAARDFGMTLVRMQARQQGASQSTVAELEGRVVGVIQAGKGDEELKVTPRLAVSALRIFGVGIVSVLGRTRARLRVSHRPPAGAYHVAEVDVDPAYRNRGIGGALLDHAEQEAREQGFQTMWLSTTTINPARRLYERHGFHVAHTRTDRLYERYTGIAGRHLMVKEL